MRSPHRPIRELAVPVAPGRTLGVAEFGDPNGFPVVWSHGTPGGRLQLPPNAPARAAALGIRLFGVERPGTGRSTPHHYDCVRDYAADIDAMTRNLGFDRFGVIGLSGGGPYTLACAHDLPDRVVAAAVIGGMAPLAGPDAASGPLQKLAPFAAPILDRVSATVGRNLPRILHPFIPHAAAAVRAFAAIAPKADRPVLLDPAVANVLVGDLLHVMDEGLAAPAEDLRLLAHDWGFRLSEITVPIRFFQGDADGIVPLESALHQAGLVQDSTVTILKGGGHLAGYVDAGPVFEAIAPFFPGRAQEDQTVGLG